MSKKEKPPKKPPRAEARTPKIGRRKTASLMKIYRALFSHFGPLHWWPGETQFEVMIGAILTQQAAWSNVEKAIGKLKKENMLELEKIANADIDKLKVLIRSAGYFNQKSVRIRDFSKYILDNYGGDLDKFFSRDTQTVRGELLSLKGIGRETADSMLLYAGGKRIFVVDAYTFRALKRIGILPQGAKYDYDSIRALFENSIPQDARLYNEFHAQIVMLGKNYCKNKKPLCQECPLFGICAKKY